MICFSRQLFPCKSPPGIRASMLENNDKLSNAPTTSRSFRLMALWSGTIGLFSPWKNVFEDRATGSPHHPHVIVS